MWLAFIVIAIIIGAVLGIAGAGIYAVPIVLILLAGAGVLFMNQAKNTAASGEVPGSDPDEVPQDTVNAGDHQRTGYAHRGQEHMVPGQGR
jgi:hypothetical protein